MKTLFIGAGSMAHALMSGALKAGVLKNENVYVRIMRNNSKERKYYLKGLTKN